MANNGQHQWDKEVDVLVVGFGAAGGISAITAHDAGAKVLLIEKMPPSRRHLDSLGRRRRFRAQRRRRFSIFASQLQRHHARRYSAQDG